MLNTDRFLSRAREAQAFSPYWHTIVDDFLSLETAAALAEEFPAFTDEAWYCYKNKLEDKKALNDWNKYPAATYALLTFLNSPGFIAGVSELVGVELFPDPGMHGGGWHIHGNGGKLNPHLDYSIHPKLGLQRKVNLIIYFCDSWQDSWGGHFGIWEHDAETQQPGRLVRELPVGFNRALLFDTTQNSWHGMSREVNAPEGNFRRSIAVYYLCQPAADAAARGRALFAPTAAQAGDREVEELIRKRASVGESKQVYRTE